MSHHINGIAWAKAGRGEYAIEMAMPPVRPEIMNNIVASLTDDEIAALPEIKAAYDNQMERWRNTTRDTSEMAAALRADLEADYNMADHPKRDALWNAANSQCGIYNGTNDRTMDILLAYGDLYRLVR